MMSKARMVVLCALCVVIVGIGVGQLADFEWEFIVAARQFIASPEGGGENNGLKDYLKAYEMFDTQIYLQNQPVFDRILKQGWTGQEQQQVGVLQSLQPVLAEIGNGNQKEFVRYPPMTDPLKHRMPNFLKCQLLGKLLVIQVKYCQHIGKPEFALNWAKHALKFGQRMTDENSPLIAKLISIAVEKIALDAWGNLLLLGGFDAKKYRELASWLEELEQHDVPFWHMLEQEGRNSRWYIEHAEQAFNAPGRKAPLTAEEKQQLEYFKANRERVIKQLEEFWSAVVELNKKPYPEFARADFNSLRNSLDPMVRDSAPNFMEGRTRAHVTKARWRMTTALAQLMAYRVGKGKFPGSLEEASQSIGMSVPVDPFTMQPLKYRSDGKHGVVYSVGPDMADNQAGVAYDPTNGTRSVGDVVVGF